MASLFGSRLFSYSCSFALLVYELSFLICSGDLFLKPQGMLKLLLITKMCVPSGHLHLYSIDNYFEHSNVM